MLTTCPACGKQVSDTAKICVHCGAALNPAGTSLKKYNNLSDAKTQEFMNEFVSTFPKYGRRLDKSDKFSKKTSVVSISLTVIAVALLVLVFLVSEGILEFPQAVITALIAVLVLITAGLLTFVIAVRFLLRKHMRFKALYIKKYYTWLEKCKGYSADVVLDAKTKKYYDAITSIESEEKLFGVD